jgi:hypothetical protein
MEFCKSDFRCTPTEVEVEACLLTTGAMKSAPTIALEAMLDLPPLPVMVKKEAAQSAFIMLDTYKPNTEDMQGHLRVYKDFQDIMELHSLSDRLPRKFDFEADFKVVIPERDAWDMGQHPGGSGGIGVLYGRLKKRRTSGNGNLWTLSEAL